MMVRGMEAFLQIYKTLIHLSFFQIKRKEIKQRFVKSVLRMYVGYDPLHHRLKVIGERIFLYYFPLTLVKLLLHGKLISLTVNGITGRVTSNAAFEKIIEQKKIPRPIMDTLMVLLSSILASSLFALNSGFAKQMAVAILIIVMTILWIKK